MQTKLLTFLHSLVLPILLITGAFGIFFSLTFQSEHDAYAMSYKIYSLDIGNQTYTVQYLLPNATITRMELDQSDKTLRLNFAARGDGVLTIFVPRELIDSLNEDGDDSPFGIIVYTQENDEYENTRLYDVYATPTVRRLDISFSADTSLIEIKGSQVIPEFPSAQILVITISILLGISFLSRSNFKAWLQKN